MITSDLFIVKFAVLWAGLQLTNGEREHKVHNIVLYPDKHSWCRTTPIKQVITSPGFDSVTIDNNICVGTCFSYSIPKTNPAEPGELIGPYCDSCQPSQIKCYHVNLRSDTQVIQKRVQIIQNCTCISCDKTDKHDCEIVDKQTTDELPLNMLSMENNDVKTSTDSLPDLFEIPKLNNLKKNKKLLDSVKQDFANIDWNSTIDDENLIQKHKIILEHQDLDHNEEDNAKIEEDLEKLPDNFGLEGSPSELKGAHIAMGINRDETKPKMNVHVHHLGEIQQVGLNLEQIVKGPHGSMVLTPIEEKLHIDSDNLKPIDEGIVVSYENHHHQHHKKHVDDESN